MKASIAAAAIIAAVSVVILVSVPADATHKPYCGKRWVEAGFFFVDKHCPFQTASAHNKAAQSARGQCKSELTERGKYTYGSNFSGLEKFSSHCVLQKEGDICKFWCVCSGEPCWQPYSVKPGDYKFDRTPFRLPPGDTDLRVPRPPPRGLSIPRGR